MVAGGPVERTAALPQPCVTTGGHEPMRGWQLGPRVRELGVKRVGLGVPDMGDEPNAPS